MMLVYPPTHESEIAKRDCCRNEYALAESMRLMLDRLNNRFN
jgi:hypothetical protein